MSGPLVWQQGYRPERRLSKRSGRHTRRDSDGDRVEVGPQLNIWVGVRKYELKDLQDPELEWLAAELSCWLQVPVEKKKV